MGPASLARQFTVGKNLTLATSSAVDKQHAARNILLRITDKILYGVRYCFSSLSMYELCVCSGRVCVDREIC